MPHKLPLWHIDVYIPGMCPDIDPATGGAAGVLSYANFASDAPTFIVNLSIRHISAYDDPAATGTHAQAAAQPSGLYQYFPVAFTFVIRLAWGPSFPALIYKALPGPTIVKEVERCIAQ